MSRLGGPGARTSPVVALALAIAVLLALSGCETTAEKSAALRRAAKHVALNEKGLSIAADSRDVSVLGASVVRDSEGAAVVVTLRNHSAHALREVPIAITVKSAAGSVLFQNNGVGLERALVSVPSIAAHGTVVWVDDQVPASGGPASASARVGPAPTLAGALPAISSGSVHLGEDPSNGVVARGTVSNRSKVAQRTLVLFAVARRAGRIVAAGRQILPELAPGASSSYEVALLGNASGATPQVQAPASSLR